MEQVYELVSKDGRYRWGTYTSPALAEKAKSRLIEKLYDNSDGIHRRRPQDYLILTTTLNQDLF